MWVLWRWLGSAGGGAENFSAPFSGYLGKWADSFRDLGSERLFLTAPQNMATLVALAVQLGFFALRRRWGESWWRVGAVYAALMALLGASVWAGYPPAAARVLLPMTLAFNVLVPRGRRWWLVLVLGNLNVLASRDVLMLPSPESYRLEGPKALRIVPSTGHIVEPVFDRRWYPPEHSYLEYWRWSDGPSTLVLRNPQSFALRADLTFSLHSIAIRPMAVREGGRVLWSGLALPRKGTKVEVRDLRLAPGDTVLAFDTPEPPGFNDGPVRGPPVFNLRNLRIVLLGRAD
jgi:hypothetical protein